MSGRYREGGRISVVAVKRGSTVTCFVHAASLVQERSSVMSSKAKARNALTLKKKCELIDFANKNPRLGSRALAEKFGCGKAQVNRILLSKKESLLEEFESNISSDSASLSKKSRLCEFSEINESLYKWYTLVPTHYIYLNIQ